MSSVEQQIFTVYDHGQELIFAGELLGSGTSYTDWKARWFEITIYRTEGGKYVAFGAGRSILVHRPTCRQVAERALPLEDASDEAIPCDECRPDFADRVISETDRVWALVSDDPSAIIERLRMRDADGVHYLPRTSADALADAARKDPALAAALRTPQRIA